MLLQEALLQVCSGLAHYAQTRVLSDSEQPQLATACKAATKMMCPHIAGCYTRIYPHQTSQAKVDSAAVTQPLSQLLVSWDAVGSAQGNGSYVAAVSVCKGSHSPVSYCSLGREIQYVPVKTYNGSHVLVWVLSSQSIAQLTAGHCCLNLHLIAIFLGPAVPLQQKWTLHKV